MRIATWNINGTKARIDLLLHWLAARKPDIVGLQELKMTDEQFPHRQLETVGYRAITHGQKSWNGVAILTRTDAPPVAVTQVGLPGEAEFGARLLTADVAGISFTTVYVPNGKTIEHDDFRRKLAWLDSLISYFDKRAEASRPAVVCGDFNLCPQPIDSWSEERLHGVIFHTDAERQRFARLVDLGFVDAFRALYPDTKEFSWWDYRAGAFHKRMGLRIDLLFATASLMPRIRAVEIDREYRKKQDGLTPSDHAPVFADFEP